MNLVELAQRIKRLRRERDLTLEEVSSRAGLTRSWLSKVENFRATPSLPALAAIAEVLDVPLAELFEGLSARPSMAIVRRDERRRMDRDEDISELQYESLAYPRPARKMDPVVITVPPSDKRPPLAHGGEEFLFVLSGGVRLEYGDELFELNAGDSAYFDGERPHRLVCRSAEPAQVLVIFHGANGQDELQSAGMT